MHVPSDTEITKEKLECLKPRGWLNDEVNTYTECLFDIAIKQIEEDVKWCFNISAYYIFFSSLQVINLYIELLKERAEREPKRFLKCHFFNTFFFKKVS